MTISKTHSIAISEFPTALQILIRAELAAGNSIAEISGGFPAPPVGACLKLAKRVTTRPHESDKEIQYCKRNRTDYSGEFTDAKRFFFVLEPPLPSDSDPDMNVLRAERQGASGPPILLSPQRRSARLKNFVNKPNGALSYRMQFIRRHRRRCYRRGWIGFVQAWS